MPHPKNFVETRRAVFSFLAHRAVLLLIPLKIKGYRNKIRQRTPPVVFFYKKKDF